MDKVIALALREDIGQADITTNLLVGKKAKTSAVILTREDCVVAGLEVAKKVFRRLDKNVRFRHLVKDGTRVKAGTKLLIVTGKTRAILTGERVALNFLSRLSAIATKTAAFVEKVRPYKAKIYDTRKTTPTLRILEKEAVRLGGGINHRFNLYEMVLIKDNHHVVLKKEISPKKLIRDIRRRTHKPIAVEVDNLHDFQQVLKGRPDYILLDNMNVQQIRAAIRMKRKAGLVHKPELEVSGRVNIRNVETFARLGVDRISIGALTHSIKAVDMSLDLKEERNAV